MPEAYQPADGSLRAKVPTVVAVVVMVGLATVLGAVLGGVAGEGALPSRADVRAAAHSLVPPGYAVASEKLRAVEDPGVGFAPAAYAVDLDVEGGGALDSRSADFRRQATKEGWRLIGTQSDTGSSVTFERSRLYGRVTVGEEGGLSTIEMVRHQEITLAPLYPFAGALVGLAIGLAGGFLVLRSRRPPRPSG